MDGSANRVFISYRRDDAAGYAGRLEEALEKRLGHGSVFRDVIDIAPGADFVDAIRQRLAGAQAVLVLIGPRWAGGGATGARRIDDAQDFVRLEVQAALDAGVRLVPVLLPGAAMPSDAELPEPLKPLARRNAMSIGDIHWDADIDLLAGSLGLVPARRRVWPWALGGAVAAALVAGALCWLKPWVSADPAARLLGSWAADVQYSWGAQYTERLEFKRHAGAVTGTATWLGYPRGIEKLQIDGPNLRFETRSQESSGGTTFDLLHSYSIELRGKPPDEVLAVREHTTGGFGGSRKPMEFEARRVPSGTAQDSAARAASARP